MTKHHIRSSIINLFRFIWSLFLNGLFTILPVTLTIAIFLFSFHLLVHWLSPLRDLLMSYSWTHSYLQNIPHAELWLAIVAILFIGALMKFLLLHSLLLWIEQHVEKVPILGSIYSGVHKLVNAFSPHTKVTFQQVVIVEFPHKGIYAVGFLAQETPKEYCPVAGKEFANVFVPSTPNPTTGFFLLVPKDEMILSSLTRQEAMTLIMSGGIIQPKEKEAEK